MLIKDFSKCYSCGEKLKRSARQRVKPCLCMGCKVKNDRTGANTISMEFKKQKKAAIPVTSDELLAERLAWKAQELIVDHNDRVVR